jgi:hypothetical protein
MVHVSARDRDKLSNKAMAGKTMKRMTESVRIEHMKASREDMNWSEVASAAKIIPKLKNNFYYFQSKTAQEKPIHVLEQKGVFRLD